MPTKFLIVLSAFLFTCFNVGYSQNAQNQSFEYKIKENEFSIVVIKNHTNQKRLKQLALNKAAILANKNQFASFDIIKEDQVEVMLGKTNWPSSYDFPQNLYQEQIIEKDGYNRERNISKSQTDTKLRKAYKIQIKCYKDKNGAYKVCDLIKCS
jgi:hypothetical protein